MSPSGGWGRDVKVSDVKIGVIEGLMRDSRADLKECDTSKIMIGSPQIQSWDSYKASRRFTSQEGLEVCRHCTHAQIQSHLAADGSALSPVDSLKEEEEQSDSMRPRRYTCCGLRPAAFYAIFLLSLLLIIGGVIGGVLGTKALRPSAVAVTSNPNPAGTVAPPTTTSGSDSASTAEL